jgi:DtxR family Mn-dependent transcriptional regulator
MITLSQADEDARRMEHAVSPYTLERIEDFMRFIEQCPRGGNDWVARFNEYRPHGEPINTEKCIEKMKAFVRAYARRVRSRK